MSRYRLLCGCRSLIHPFIAGSLAAGGAFVVTAATLAAQGTFAGSVTYQTAWGDNADKTGSGTMTITEEGTHRRMDMQMAGGAGMGQMMGNSISMITDDATHTSITLLNDKKMYITHTYTPPPPKPDANTNHANTDMSGIDFKKTGTETIAGISCDDYVFTMTQQGKQRQSLVCAAHGMGFLWDTRAMQDRMQQMGPNVSPQIVAFMQEFKDGFFPLKMADIKDGKQDVKMLAIKVDRTAPPATAFTAPPDYTLFQMGAMPHPQP